MLHQGQRLKLLIERSKYNNTDVARLSGISEASLYNYFRMEEINSKKLNVLCKALDWKIDWFFSKSSTSEVEEYENKIEALQKENEMLRQQLADKEEIIALLKARK